ncbi:MAG: hypothetical protein ABJZ55_22915 [Fuerstiella sp.]
MFKSLRKTGCDSSKANAFPIVTNALVWAAMMLASAWLTVPREGGNSNTMMMMLVAGWFATHSLIAKSTSSND